MSRHLQAARRSCTILPHIGLLEAIDAALNNGNPAIPLRREAALSPVRVKLLDALAQSAEYIDDGQLFTVCLRRCLELDPVHAGEYVETASRRLSEPQIIERLLPRQPDLLLDFAQEARSPAGKDRALMEAAAAIQERPPGDPDLTFLRGRLTRGRGDISAAIAELQQAVADQPLEPIRKLHLAEALLADGQPEAARDQLDAARRLAPDDRQIKARIRELETRFESP
jgi:predicted Zn-dependent protease